MRVGDKFEVGVSVGLEDGGWLRPGLMYEVTEDNIEIVRLALVAGKVSAWWARGVPGEREPAPIREDLEKLTKDELVVRGKALDVAMEGRETKAELVKKIGKAR